MLREVSIRWSLGMDNWFNPTHHNGCKCLSMLGLKLKHVNKKVPDVEVIEAAWLRWWGTMIPISPVTEITIEVWDEIQQNGSKSFNSTVQFTFGLIDTSGYISSTPVSRSHQFRCAVVHHHRNGSRGYQTQTIYLINFKMYKLYTQKLWLIWEHLTHKN